MGNNLEKNSLEKNVNGKISSGCPVDHSSRPEDSGTSESTSCPIKSPIEKGNTIERTNFSVNIQILVSVLKDIFSQKIGEIMFFFRKRE